MQLTDRISLLELIWTIGGLIGLAASLYAAWDAWKDEQAQAASGANGARLALATNGRRAAVAISVTLVLFVLAGALAMFRVNTGPTQIGSYILSAVLIAAEYVLVWAVTSNMLTRRYVLQQDTQAVQAEIDRLATVALLSAEHIDANTQAVVENTQAIAKQTDVLVEVLPRDPNARTQATDEAR